MKVQIQRAIEAVQISGIEVGVVEVGLDVIKVFAKDCAPKMQEKISKGARTDWDNAPDFE